MSSPHNHRLELWLLAGILLIFSLFLVRDLIFRDNIIAFWDWMGFGNPSYSELFTNLHTWQPAYLGHAYSQMTSLLFTYLLVILCGGTFWSNILLCISIPLSMLSMYFLASRFFDDPRAAFLSAIVYTVNPWVLDRFLQAHIGVLLAYAVLPFIFILVWELYTGMSVSRSVIYILLAGTFTAFCGGISSQFLYLIGILLLILLIFRTLQDRSLKALARTVITTICIFGISAVLLISWIVYLINYQNIASVPTLVDVQFMNVLSGSIPLYNVIRMVEMPGPGFLVNLGYFSITPWTLLGFVIPAFAFAALVFHKKESRNLVILLFCTCIVGIILATGTTYLSGLYTFLYTKIPFFYAFRESSKFLVFVTFAYALMAGITADYLLKNSSDLVKRLTNISLPDNRHFGTGIIIGVLALHLISSAPMLTGDMAVSSIHPAYTLPGDYVKMGDWLNQQNDTFRVIVLPYDNYIFHTWHLVTATPLANIDYISLEAMPLPSYQFSTYYLNQVISPATNSSGLGQLLDRADVKYIIVKDEIYNEPYPDAYSVGTYRVNSTELNERMSKFFPISTRFDGYTVYLNPSYSHNYSGKPILAVGNRSLMAQPFTANRSLIYLGQQTDPKSVLPYSNQILTNANISELIPILADARYKINAYDFAEPAHDLPTISKEMQSGWVRSDTFEYESPFLFKTGAITYGQGYAVTTGNQSFSIPFTADDTTNYEIWVRAYVENPCNITIDHQNISELWKTGSDFEYHKMGTIPLAKGKHHLGFMPSGMVAIDQVLIAPVGQMNDVDQEVADILKNKTIINATSINQSPSFEKKQDTVQVNFISPTEYTAAYQSRDPFILNLKQSYHPLWEARVDLEKIRPVIVDSYATGFYIDNGTQVTIDFIPQNTMDSLPSIQTLLLKTMYPEGNGR